MHLGEILGQRTGRVSDAQTKPHETVDEDRRDFIHIATAATAVAGAGALAYVFVDQMNAASDTKAASSLDVDVSKVPVGGEIRVLIGGKPFFIRHRTPAEIRAAQSVDLSSLPDPQSDEERLVPMQSGEYNPAILVTSGSCTHLGCVPVGPAQGNTGDFGGWYCPCHGSHYDTSGRIRRGPAPANLPVPDYNWLSAAVINISL
ncbi:MAG TPA: ubiquinol-cytochrome c reductase iron-sulfur subunit [Henriciella marina]|nr:ubiquinol-cytochrome c reductase iron-sulfur subunit [Henriciella sp.]HIK63652.1 ubiquinol-cytochrome c reductase iron-sulfur subunit [Henriciella marina]